MRTAVCSLWRASRDFVCSGLGRSFRGFCQYFGAGGRFQIASARWANVQPTSADDDIANHRFRAADGSQIGNVLAVIRRLDLCPAERRCIGAHAVKLAQGPSRSASERCVHCGLKGRRGNIVLRNARRSVTEQRGEQDGIQHQ